MFDVLFGNYFGLLETSFNTLDSIDFDDLFSLDVLTEFDFYEAPHADLNKYDSAEMFFGNTSEALPDSAIPEMPTTDGSDLVGAKLVYGDPASSALIYNPQQYSDTCAIMCQGDIIQEMTGEAISEEALRAFALENNIYTPGGGTAPEHVGDIMEHYGMDVENHEGSSIEELKQALDGGKQVIVGVDAEEIWNPDVDQHTLNEMMGFPDAGHAVRVIGIEEDMVSGETYVIINDPGVSDGAGNRIAQDVFLDAWQDMNNFTCTAVI